MVRSPKGTAAIREALPTVSRCSPNPIRGGARPSLTLAGFRPAGIWSILEAFPGMQAVGGHSYNAYVARLLHDAGAEAVATFNRRHFAGLVTGLAVIDPGEGSQA